MINSNLPIQNPTPMLKSFFDDMSNAIMSFPSEQVDAVIGFFEHRGFDSMAANSTAVVLLRRARQENTSIFKLLDTLKGFDEIKLSAIVTEVLNLSRQKSSILGYRQDTNNDFYDKRNIIL